MLSSITLIDKDREWFKSRTGIETAQEGPRDISFCGHALAQKEIFVVEDTKKDPRFLDNPYVVGPPYIRFYAGVYEGCFKLISFSASFAKFSKSDISFSLKLRGLLSLIQNTPTG